MRRALVAAACILFAAPAVASAACVPVVPGSSTATAALLNPASVVSGTVDATGCRYGIYYSPGVAGRVEGANIVGATGYGVYVGSGAAVNVVNTTITLPTPGATYGIYFRPGSTGLVDGAHIVAGMGGVYVTGEDAMTAVDVVNSTITGPLFGLYYRVMRGLGGATGTVERNVVNGYQGIGVYLLGAGVDVQVLGNRLTAATMPDPGTHGVIVSSAARATVVGNRISDNVYGVAVVGGGPGGGGPFSTGSQVVNNELWNNANGIVLSNYTLVGEVPTPLTFATNHKVANNTVAFGGTSPGFGIRVEGGVNDKVIANSVSGYADAIVIWPDLAAATKVEANTPPSVTGAAPSAARSASPPPAVPVKGVCNTVVTMLGIVQSEEGPRFHMLIDGPCTVSHLGDVTLHADQSALVVPNFGLTGEFTMTAANGDLLRVIERDDAFGAPDPADPTRVLLSGTSRFSGGTGRFTGATGEFSVVGWASLATNTGYYEFEGTVQYDASAVIVK